MTTRLIDLGALGAAKLSTGDDKSFSLQFLGPGMPYATLFSDKPLIPLRDALNEAFPVDAEDTSVCREAHAKTMGELTATKAEIDALTMELKDAREENERLNRLLAVAQVELDRLTKQLRSPLLPAGAYLRCEKCGTDRVIKFDYAIVEKPSGRIEVTQEMVDRMKEKLGRYFYSDDYLRHTLEYVLEGK